MSIKSITQDSYVSGKKEITVSSGGIDVTLFVKELGYLAIQAIYAKSSGSGQNGLALLVSESVSDKDGNKFTYDEVLDLKKAVAEPLFKAVAEIQGLNGEEKK